MWVQYEPMKYGADYTYPPWAQAVGLCMAFSSMMCVPAYAVYAMVKAEGSLKQVGSCSSSTLCYLKVDILSF